MHSVHAMRVSWVVPDGGVWFWVVMGTAVLPDLHCPGLSGQLAHSAYTAPLHT